MRILHVTPHLRVGGAERLIAALSRIQTERPGWEVAVAGEPGAVSDELTVPFFSLPRCSGQLARATAWRGVLDDVVTGFKPDLIHAHALHTALPHVGLLRRQPVVLTRHSSRVSRDLVGVLSALALPLHIVFVSAHSAARVRRLLPPHRKNRVHAIANGIDTDFWSPLSQPIAGDPLILWVGRLVEDKNPLAVVDVFERVTSSLPEAKLAIAGDGPLMEALRARVSHSAVGHRIQLHGERSPVELRELYRAAGAMLSTSIREGLPLTLLEGLATGISPVAPDLPTLLIDELNPVRFYDRGDCDMAASCVVEALGQSRRSEVSVRSIRTCEADYADLYESLTDARISRMAA